MPRREHSSTLRKRRQSPGGSNDRDRAPELLERMASETSELMRDQDDGSGVWQQSALVADLKCPIKSCLPMRMSLDQRSFMFAADRGSAISQSPGIRIAAPHKDMDVSRGKRCRNTDG